MGERELAKIAGVSRETFRKAHKDPASVKPALLQKICASLNSDLLLQIVPRAPCRSEYSSVATSIKTDRDGFSSWKLHFMDFVDEFRRAGDYRLILLPPIHEFDRRLFALFQAIVRSLCKEREIRAPDWARTITFLERPWFVAEMSSLKAMALKESPIEFRAQNIFVLENFLQRV